MTRLVPAFNSSVNVQVTTVTDGTLTPLHNTVQTLEIDATGGSFSIGLLGKNTGAIAFNASAQDLYNALNPILNPNNTNTALPFTDNFAVTKHGNVFQILFQGQYQNLAIDPNDIDTSTLVGSLKLANRTSGIDYYSFDTLNIDLGSGPDVFNIQGTRANTFVNGNEGDDRIYVSSLAALTPTTTTDFLRGNLDDVRGPLHIDVGRRPFDAHDHQRRSRP